MKKIVNNPKLMAILSVIFILFPLWFYVKLLFNRIVGMRPGYLFYILSILLFFAVAIAYYLLILFKKKINLKLFHYLILITILLNVLSSVLIYSGYFLHFYYFFVDEAILGNLCIVVFLCLIMFYKGKKTEKMYNILTIVGIASLVVCNYIIPVIIDGGMFSEIYNYLVIFIKNYFYIIPMILYFRLYALNLLKKEVK